MSSTNKQFKKLKTKQSPQSQYNPLMDELKNVIKSLNEFLKKYFDKSYNNLEEYTELVKQYFIQQSTNSNYSCLIGSLFSKVSNMLQPFLQTKVPKYVASQQKLHEDLSNLTHKFQKQKKKIINLKQELNQYKETSTRLTNFIYMLKINNIDVDLLYQKGCEQTSKRSSTQIYMDRDLELLQQSNTQCLKKNQVQNYQTR